MILIPSKAVLANALTTVICAGLLSAISTLLNTTKLALDDTIISQRKDCFPINTINRYVCLQRWSTLLLWFLQRLKLLQRILTHQTLKLKT